MEKIVTFMDLNAWKEGHKLVLMIYKVIRKFPVEERFGLVLQLIRAAVSITSNIAEGFGRQSRKEKINFFYISLSSLMETQNQVIIAKDLSYIGEIDFTLIWNQSIIVQKLVLGLIKSATSHNS